MTRTTFQLVLIDDDDLIRSAWTMVARTRGHNLRCFSCWEEFLAAGVETSAHVYVDYMLADGVNGIEIASRLLSSGYSHVYLSTGSSINCRLPEGLCGVVGKEYPSKSFNPRSY